MTEEQKVAEEETPATLEGIAYSVKKLSTRISSVEGVARAALKHAQDVRYLATGAALDKAQKDAKEIHDLYRAAILKINVSTEVVFIARTANSDPGLARKLAIAAVLAFDLPNFWWTEREHLELNAWMRLLAGIYVYGLPSVDTQAEDLSDQDITGDTK